MDKLWIKPTFILIIKQDIRILEILWSNYPFLLKLNRYNRNGNELLSTDIYRIYTVYDLELLERNLSKKYNFAIGSRGRWLPYFNIKFRRKSVEQKNQNNEEKEKKIKKRRCYSFC